MQIEETTLVGVCRVHSEKRGDSRGYLIRTYCEETFAAAGLNTRWVQSSLTWSSAAGTLRGMHFQKPPFGEIKLIRCIVGRVWDCLVDVRPDSPTFGKWEAFDLNEELGDCLYVPEGIAHGFYSLTSDARLHYWMSAPYSADHAAGIRWDDPGVGISWPGAPQVISQKDQDLPLLKQL